LQNDYDNWCPEIYRGLFVDRFNQDQLKIAPCCAALVSIEDSDNFSFETSPYLTKLREQFDRGDRPVECNYCWKAEACGGESRRKTAINFYQVSHEDKNKVILEGIDYNSTWACNLACVMCGPSCSSSWATDLNLTKSKLKKLGRLYRNNNNILEKLDLSHVKKIHFNGGEPLLNNDQNVMLLKLEQVGILKNIQISYNTNGTIKPSTDTKALWNKAKVVILWFSIDAVEQAFEYIRQPAKWDQVSKNLLNMKEVMPSNVMFGFNITVGSHNIFELEKLITWIQENLATSRDGYKNLVSWQLAYRFDPKYLTKEAKLEAIKYLTPIESFTSLASYLTSTLDIESNNSWIELLDTIDARRNTNWKQALQISKYY
jgi:MoaA/NifB/PqqE/SkfB family radical SAM enzyme